MNLRGILVVALSLAVALGGGGCATPPPPPPKPEPKPDPTVVRLELVGDSQVNSDARGRPSPVVVRYYVLQSLAPFEAADFFTLFERDEAALGTSKLLREELTLKPGDTHRTELRPPPEGKFLATFVAYRDFNKLRWRANAAFPLNKTSSYSILVGRYGVQISSKFLWAP